MDEIPVISDIHLMTGGSRSTVQRSLRKLDKLGVISTKVDLVDQRRRQLDLARPFKTLLDRFVDECFEEFKELIELRDRGERRRAEAALKESEEKYRSLFEHANDAILVSDPQTHCILDANETTGRRLGYTRDELLQMKATEITHPARLPFQKDIYAALEETGETMFEGIHLHKDGSAIPVEVSARLIEYGGRRVIQSFARDITERKLAEAALMESEARLMAILENSPFGVVVASITERKRFFVNSRYVEMFGGESRESFLIGDFIETFADRNAFREDWAEYQRTGHLAGAEAERLRRDGSSWWCLYDWRPLTFKGVEAVIIWHHDITDRVRATRLLRESEQRFHDFADSAADRFWETDENYRITYLSPAPPGFNLPRVDEIIGRVRWELEGIDPDPEIWDAHRADIAGRHPFRDFRFRRTRPNGDVAHVRLNGKPFFDAEGKFTGYRGTHNDETELVEARQEIERTLTESEDRYRDLYDNAPVPYYSLDPADGRFTAANKAALELFGSDLRSLTGKTVADFQSGDPPDLKERAKRLQRMASGQAFRDLELEIRAFDGTPKWVNLSVDPIRKDRDTVVELRATATDITERKRAELLAREAHAQLRDAFESISGRVSLYDSEDRFVMCNSRFLEELHKLEGVMVPGTSFETILRASVDKGLHPQLKGDEDKWIAMRIARHRTLDTFERQSEGGRWEQVDRYRTHDGGTLIIGTDVTERKMVEDKLRRTQQRLIEAISRVAIGVDIYDAQDRLSLTSGGQGRIGSQTPDLFVIGDNFEVILRRTVESGRIPEANEDPEKWIQWRLARHRQKKHPTEFMHNDGTWVQLLEYATDDGGTLVIRSDITERKNAEVEI